MRLAREIADQSTVPVIDSSLCQSPTVSVAIICFNQADYIEKALDGVFMQKTDFEFEVVIADDCSTDGTAEIIAKYQRRYPEKTVLLLASDNLGKHTGNGRINLIRCLDRCRGQFVAHLEGDDYWTDPEKLQTQVEFLKANPDCSLCHHPVEYVNSENKNTGSSERDKLAARTTLTDLYQTISNPIFTGSICYRRLDVDRIPDAFLNLAMLDWPLTFLLLKDSHGGSIDRVMSRYRIHDGGIWSMKSQYWRSWQKLRAAKVVFRELGLPESKDQQHLLFQLRWSLADGLSMLGKHRRARRLKSCLWKQRPIPSFLHVFRRLTRKIYRRTVATLVPKQ